MSPSAELATTVRFGTCECDLRSGELRRQGKTVRLTEQSRRLLIALLEHPGELVTREELAEHLWPGQVFGDFTDGLNTAVNKLRVALKDSASHPRYVETFPRRGYRFIAQIESGPTREAKQPLRDGLEAPAAARSEPRGNQSATVSACGGAVAASAAPGSVPQRWRLRAAAAFAGAAAVFAAWWLAPAPPPRVNGIEQITFSGKIDTPVKPVSDGNRVYYIARDGDHWNLMRTAPGEGDGERIPVPANSAMAMDASHSQLLLGTFIRRGDEAQLWTAPAEGAATQLDNIHADAAAYSPDGKQIAFLRARGLWILDAGTANPRKLADLAEPAGWLAWSPNGLRLRFTEGAVFGTAANSIWEESSQGGPPHQLLPRKGRVESDCCGSWTSDGHYFIFTSNRGGTGMNLWARREDVTSWRRQPPGPFQLTAGPDMPFGGIASGDGRRVFFYNGGFRDELERLDLKTGQSTPLSTGERAMHVSYSRDGNLMAFIDAQNHTLVRSRADGSGEQIELVRASFSPVFPRWSPDGKWIMFMGLSRNHSSQAFVVASEGGEPERLLADGVGFRDADWSGDGQHVVLVRDLPGSEDSQGLLMVDFATRRTQFIPGSRQMSATRWSPDGRFISATSDDQTQLKLWDVAARRWRTIASGAALGIALWSPDSRYLYFQDLLGAGEAIQRYDVARGQGELVANFAPILRSGVSRCALAGIMPDGSPIVAFNRGALDLYAARVTWP